MYWAMVGATWTTALLSLIALRYRIPAMLRQAVGIAGLVLFVAAAWRWWSGAWSADIDPAFFTMLRGVFCDDFVSKIGDRRSVAVTQDAP